MPVKSVLGHHTGCKFRSEFLVTGGRLITSFSLVTTTALDNSPMAPGRGTKVLPAATAGGRDCTNTALTHPFRRSQLTKHLLEVVALPQSLIQFQGGSELGPRLLLFPRSQQAGGQMEPILAVLWLAAGTPTPVPPRVGGGTDCARPLLPPL